MSKKDELASKNDKLVSLTIWERLTLADMVGVERGNAGHYYKCAKLLEILDLDDNTKNSVNLTQVSNGQLLWTENPDGSERVFDLYFTQMLYELLLSIAKKYQAWPVDRQGRTGRLLEKLDISDEGGDVFVV